MLRMMMKSKIHLATVTETVLHYEGSITIDADLMNAADILEGERVQVVNLNNGARLETYTMVGEAGSGTICLNGPAARLAEVGDKVIVISYAAMDDAQARAFKPIVVHVDDSNRIVQK